MFSGLPPSPSIPSRLFYVMAPGVLKPAGRVREGSAPASPAASAALYRGFTEDQRQTAGGAEEAGKDEQAPWRRVDGGLGTANVWNWGSFGERNKLSTCCMARSSWRSICGILDGDILGQSLVIFGGSHHMHRNTTGRESLNVMGFFWPTSKQTKLIKIIRSSKHRDKRLRTTVHESIGN